MNTDKDTPATRSFASSVFVKLTAQIAFACIVLVIVMMTLMQNVTHKVANRGVLVLAKEVTSIVATEINGAVRFLNQDDLNRALAKTIETSGGTALFAIVLDAEGNVIAQQGETTTGETDITTLATVALQTGQYEYTNDALYAAAPIYFGNVEPKVIGVVAIIWSSAQATAYADAQERTIVLISLGLLALMLLISAVISRKTISKPMTHASFVLNEFGKKNFDTDLVVSKRKDEIGSIQNNLAALKDTLVLAEDDRKKVKRAQEEQNQVVAALTTGLQALAQGDLSRTIDEDFPVEYAELKENYNTTVLSLRSTIDAVIENTKAIRDGTVEMSQSSDDLSQRTETQAATLEETAAALDEMTASVKSAADGAKEVEEIVSKATITAENGQNVVRSAVTAMAEIEQSSKQISQIISVIDDIAFQTNLLALNAGVEAARAGEAGRGFAVVASEVRALAQRSSEAAKEIKELIRDSSQQVDQGVKLVDGAGDELQKIVSSVDNIATLINRIAAGSIEQSSGITEINMGVTNLDQVTQQNAAMVQEATAACFTLNSDAQQLASLVERFTTKTACAIPSQTVSSEDDFNDFGEEHPNAALAS